VPDTDETTAFCLASQMHATIGLLNPEKKHTQKSVFLDSSLQCICSSSPSNEYGIPQWFSVESEAVF